MRLLDWPFFLCHHLCHGARGGWSLRFTDRPEIPSQLRHWKRAGKRAGRATRRLTWAVSTSELRPVNASVETTTQPHVRATDRQMCRDDRNTINSHRLPVRRASNGFIYAVSDRFSDSSNSSVRSVVQTPFSSTVNLSILLVRHKLQELIRR